MMLPRGSLAIVTADVGTVIEHAAVAFDVSVDDLRGPSRYRPLVAARHVAMMAARHMGHSFPAIAAGFGRQDHTTVVSACRKVAADASLARSAQMLADAIADRPRSLF